MQSFVFRGQQFASGGVVLPRSLAAVQLQNLITAYAEEVKLLEDAIKYNRPIL